MESIFEFYKKKYGAPILSVSAPLFVIIPRKRVPDKKFILNLNNYRNTHYITLNDAKKIYSEEIKKNILRVFLSRKKIKSAKILMRYFHRDKNVDGANPTSIIEKFVCDAITDLKIWEDDNVKILESSAWEWGGVDKENPRCEIYIFETEKV